MGKKRRLKSAKAKFGAKHSNHPRMQHLNDEKTEEVVDTPPAVVLQEEEKVEVKPKAKTTKKPRRSPRKKTTKKTTQKSS
jgi:hypothetical protein